MGTQNPAVKEAVVAWLQENPDGLSRLEAAGIKQGEFVSQIVSGDSFSERIMFMHANEFEAVTGINLRDTMLIGARRNLWGDNHQDHLPDIVSHVALQSALVKLGHEVRVKTLALKIGLQGPGALYSWTRNGRIYTEWLEKILTAISALRNPSTIRDNSPANVASRPSKKTKPSKKGSGKTSQEVERAVISATISVINSQVNVLHAAMQGNDFLCDGDKMNIVSVAARLLETCGVDSAFVEQSGQVTPISKGTKRLLSGLLS
jgi:hypothetical protein